MKKLLALLFLLFSVGIANAQTTCTSTLNQTQVLSSFADNSTHGITARNLRDFVCSNSTGAATGVPVFPITAYGAACNGSGDDTSAINAAVSAASAAASSAGGQAAVLLCKNVLTTTTINVTQSNVKIVGLGSGTVTGDCTGAGTTWTWGGSAGGMVLTFSTPASGTTFTSFNGGAENFCMNGGGTASVGLETLSRFSIRHFNLSFAGFTSEAMLFATQVTSATTFGNQRGDVSFITCSATGSADCVYLDGNATSNTSINPGWHDFELEVANGNGIAFHGSDTNIIRGVRVEVTGSGAPVKFFGSSLVNQGSSYNIVEGVSGNTPVIFDNTSAFPSSHNSVVWLDRANGNPIPQMTGGGNVTPPYGYYSYTDQSVGFINDCPAVYPYTISGVSVLAIQCPTVFAIPNSTLGQWFYYSTNTNAVGPVQGNGPFALGTNFTGGLAEIDFFNTTLASASRGFQWYQSTGASTSLLLASLTSSGFTASTSFTTPVLTTSAFVGTGTAPTCSSTNIGAQGSCTASLGANDVVGQVTLTPSGAGIAGQGTVTLTLAAASGPHSSGCLWNPVLTSWVSPTTVIGNTTPSTPTVNWTNVGNLTSGSTYSLVYHCLGF